LLRYVESGSNTGSVSMHLKKAREINIASQIVGIPSLFSLLHSPFNIFLLAETHSSAKQPLSAYFLKRNSFSQKTLCVRDQYFLMNPVSEIEMFMYKRVAPAPRPF
jgi:hypothetical protein